MDKPSDNSQTSRALRTDLYELTMAQGYWLSGMRQTRGAFHLFFRQPPFEGAYAVAAGLAQVVEFLDGLRFNDADVAYLRRLNGANGKPLFDRAFLQSLAEMEFCIDLHGVAEGTVVFAHAPLLRVEGPLLQCQIIETALLNMVNFQTLIATKGSRIKMAAKGPVLEFGLRRAQGIDGGHTAARAAYLGGCDATSNVAAGARFGIPVRGTHAHSWVMAFDSEEESFAAFAEALPNNCVFLVDTYDTIQGVHHAIAEARKLRNAGHEMIGIRLDSGDLAALSIEARRLLDDAGFSDAKIVASNELDEHTITSLREQGARIDVWGVGTKLITAFDQPALGGVYKLGAIQHEGEAWQYRLKKSEDPIKVSIPGRLNVHRFASGEGLIADVIFDETMGRHDGNAAIHFYDESELKLPCGAVGNNLLQPVLRNNKLIQPMPSLQESRERCLREINALPDALRAFRTTQRAPVYLDSKLAALRSDLLHETKNQTIG